MRAEVRLPQSAYRTGLIQEIQRKLKKALDSPSQRGELLRQLFADVALEVDERATELLYGSDSYVKPKENLCFYEVLAEHYAQVPSDGKTMLTLFVQLWSQSFASQIFALLFYQWLFEMPFEQSDGYLRYTTAFVEGANQIFWLDLQSNARRFFPMYHYTFKVVMTTNLERLPSKTCQDLILLLSRFFFYYEPDELLLDFLNHMPMVCSAKGASSDMFVIELTDQLQNVKVEPVLLHYLKSAKALKGLELRATTSTRFKTALYGFTSPGGPMYPTRPVRHAAWDTLDCLFPVGRHSRHLISLFFRLLHPYYWPISFLIFVTTSIMAIVERICMIILNAFHKLLGRDDYHEL